MLLTAQLVNAGGGSHGDERPPFHEGSALFLVDSSVVTNRITRDDLLGETEEGELMV